MEDKSLVETGNLERLASFISDMNSTNSSSAKSQKLQAYAGDEYIAKALLYTYDPYRRYYVTPANAEKNENLIEEHDDSLFEMLDSLNERKYTGHAAIGRVNAFLAKHFMYSKAVLAVLDRNLKIRMDVNEINKVFVNLIPTFDVALAKTYKKEMSEPDKKGKKKVDFENEVWYASRKLDGCFDSEFVIEFEDGKKLKICDVVHNKIVGNVKSYNIKTNKIEYKAIEDWMVDFDDINEQKHEWFQIELENGVVLPPLTGNHLVYLPILRCYRRVDELVESDVLLYD